ncbi:MAG: hypothetical protein ACOVOX_09415 [Burkholderiaceae bacterium]
MKFKAAANSGHGDVYFKVDTVISPQAPREDDNMPSSLLVMSEADARVLMTLLKTQLAAFDGRKARSQR